MLAASSSSAGALTPREEQRTIGARLRQLLAALFFDLGLCYSGRHFRPDRSARAMCCNGWRPSWSWVSVNGNLSRMASWRPVNSNDPLFSWEITPLPEFHSSVRRIRASARRVISALEDAELARTGYCYPRPFGVPPLADGTRDYATEQRLSRLNLSLSIVDRFAL